MVMVRDLYPSIAPVRGNLLIVDDALDNLRVLCQLLEKHGHITRCVRDGNSAVQAALAQPPDLVLLDIRLPDMDGYTVCRRLKELPDTQQIPIIFISALDHPQDRIQGFEAGGEDYITKPFYAREVLTRIESKLQAQHWARQQCDQAVNAERQRIARDLHDSLQQTLFILGATAQSLSQQAQVPDTIKGDLTRIHTLSQAAAAELRVLLFELRPEKLLKVGLATLLRRLAESNQNRTEAELKLVADNTPLALEPDVHLAFYRIAQEALHNAISHAQASHISLVLQSNKQQVILSIVDDGLGFDTKKRGYAGSGLENMAARASAQDLELIITSGLNLGTEVKLICNRNRPPQKLYES